MRKFIFHRLYHSVTKRINPQRISQRVTLHMHTRRIARTEKGNNKTKTRGLKLTRLFATFLAAFTPLTYMKTAGRVAFITCELCAVLVLSRYRRAFARYYPDSAAAAASFTMLDWPWLSLAYERTRLIARLADNDPSSAPPWKG